MHTKYNKRCNLQYLLPTHTSVYHHLLVPTHVLQEQSSTTWTLLLTSQCGTNCRSDKPPPPSVCWALALLAHQRSGRSRPPAVHYCAAGPVRPLPDKYALTTDKRTKRWTNRQTEKHRHRVKLPLCDGGLTIKKLQAHFVSLSCQKMVVFRQSHNWTVSTQFHVSTVKNQAVTEVFSVTDAVTTTSVICVDSFLQRDAMHSGDCAVARCLSVRLSVSPSVTRHACILLKRVNMSLNFFSPSGSHTVLAFHTQRQYFDGTP